MINNTKIKELITHKLSGEWGTDDNDGNGINVLRTTNFTNSGEIDFSKIVKRNIDPQKIEKKKLISGDVIIEKSGGSPKQPVGRVVYFNAKNEKTYLCNNFTAILRPCQKVCPRYFFYALYWKHIIGVTKKYQNKTTGIINLQLDRYLEEKIYIPYPEDINKSLKVQKRLANIIEKSDDLRKKRKEAIDLCDEFLSSTFLEMFGDPVINSIGWEKRELAKMGEIVTGNTPSRKEPDNYGKYIEWIKSDNINTPHMYLTKAEEYLSQKGSVKGRIVPSGAILVTCIAGSLSCIGNSAIADRDVAFNQQINAIVPNQQFNSYFIFMMLKISKDYIQNASTNAMKGMISKGKFSKLEFIAPPITLQNDYAKIVKKIEETKQKMLQSSHELDNQFNALIQKAFKGEL